MGRIIAPFGVRGWVKVQSYTETPAGITKYREWWISRNGGWTPVEVEDAQAQGPGVVAKLAGCDDRDAAATWRGALVGIGRSELPAAPPGEFYWADLLGLEVRNIEGVSFGTISSLMETGANDVLVVEGDRERLIPFVDGVIRSVDLPGKRVTVDWGVDY